MWETRQGKRKKKKKNTKKKTEDKKTRQEHDEGEKKLEKKEATKGWDHMAEQKGRRREDQDTHRENMAKEKKGKN